MKLQAPMSLNELPIEYTRVQLVDPGYGPKDVPLTYKQLGSAKVDHDAKKCAKQLIRAVSLRRKYMTSSRQNFPEYLNDAFASQESGGKLFWSADSLLRLKDQFESLKGSINFQMREGIFNLIVAGSKESSRTEHQIEALFNSLSYSEYLEDKNAILGILADKEINDFCEKRMKTLKAKFDLHKLHNEKLEMEEQKQIPSIDFYSAYKVDTHIHATCCMTQKHFLSFLSRKYDGESGNVVLKSNNSHTKKETTLRELFDHLKLSKEDFTFDKLGMHAGLDNFNRFDKFNKTFSPLGQSVLREVFLKTNNDIEGSYYADLLKEVLNNSAQKDKCILFELRLSIYGNSQSEWTQLAKWFFANKLHEHSNNRWMIQIPRLYDLMKNAKKISNFSDILFNIFNPLFQVSMDPSSDPELDQFLTYVSGIDTVDDESKLEKCLPCLETPLSLPDEWNGPENPPYEYYTFFLFSNLRALNQLRCLKGKNTFSFRPHCGEAGRSFHLINGFLLSDNISHGINLKELPILQYLFYLCQVGICMSLTSNNTLYMRYCDSPFLDFFKTGLNLSLSTDSYLQFFGSEDPLLEEYNLASQIWQLSSVDLCEMARNSVIMSGFSDEKKAKFIGEYFKDPSPRGNNKRLTNLPDIRVAYRHECLMQELALLDLLSRAD